ncbi:N-formylglutamate deformylase [Rivibacter subsaxonicus]|uniref:N-formylglutamate deformylase n=1 Tax=Rivibacter subsaxonicus TaxID=457575 RepID=A0A4Q7W141_9BURK|nr:N-formylglutamate deformylase [Rivibacter subsaxonicus]RZU02239.1 N-formylglutamate deformylase [Rivibacter subsaxonicus]
MNAGEVFTLHHGRTPLLVSLPHVGTRIPEFARERYLPAALEVPDTDWHLDRLYAFVRDELDASLIVPRYSRYVVDLNRPPENLPMYPGVNNTELCPTRAFTGEPIYRAGYAPDEAEVTYRVQEFWRPYHDALRAELDRLRTVHGHALLWDGHSIKSELPWLFEGRLPELNLGTANGASCAPALRERLAAVLAAQSRYTQVVDGRFKGGHITRHYGSPGQGVHAVQLEMCWSTYMADEASPFAYDEARAEQVQPLLKQLLRTMVEWKPDGR